MEKLVRIFVLTRNITRKSFILVLKVLTERIVPGDSPVVTLSTLKGWRFPTYLLRSLASTATVGLHWRDIGVAYDTLPFEDFLFRVRISSFLPKKKRGVLLYDEANGRKMSCEKVVLLKRRYYSKHLSDVHVFPYFAHPDFYKNDLDKTAKTLSLRQGVRSVRLFFAGTVNRAHYDHIKSFPILSRGEVVNHVLATMKQDRFQKLKRSSRICISGDISESLAKHEMTQLEFLLGAADADFFLCPPGFRMPHCHNMVEVMSVGAIPITNYHRYMVPPLQDGVDCLAFETLEDLTNILSGIMSISEDDLCKLRRGVYYYYEQFLAPSAAGFRFLDNLKKISELAINDESGT